MARRFSTLANFRSKVVHEVGGANDGALGVLCQIQVTGRGRKTSFIVDAKSALVIMHHFLQHMDQIYNAADSELCDEMDAIDDHFTRSTDRHDCE